MPTRVFSTRSYNSKSYTSKSYTTKRYFNTLLSGLLNYWKLDGNANDSVGFNTGIGTNIVFSSGNGKIGQGAGFDGATSKIAITPMAMGTSFTIAMWINPPTYSGSYKSLFSDAPGNIGLYFKASSKRITFYYGGADHLNNTDIPLNTFTHVTVVVNVRNAQIYINGNPDSSVYNTVIIPTLATIGNDGAGEAYVGAIDEVGIWNRPLNDSEIGMLYNSNVGKQYPF